MSNMRAILEKLEQVWTTHQDMQFAEFVFIFVFGHSKLDNPESVKKLSDEFVEGRLSSILKQREGELQQVGEETKELP